jgi:hypothetical protein
MPLQPKFDIHQTDDTLTIDIRVPFVKVSDLEYRIVDDNQLYFSCKPYLLRLVLPGFVHDEEFVQTSAKYDWNVQHGTVFLCLWKKTPGQQFEDLDLLSKLIAPKPVFPSQTRCDHARRAPEVLSASRLSIPSLLCVYFFFQGLCTFRSSLRLPCSSLAAGAALLPCDTAPRQVGRTASEAAGLGWASPPHTGH